MNKIISEAEEAGVPLRVETVSCVPLGGIWNNCTLSGHFWRLYHNSHPGAGVFLKGGRFELQPGNLYFLPPFCDLRTWNESAEVRQLYIHFEMPRFGGSERCRCTGVPLDDGLREMLEELLGLFPGNSPRRLLAAAALVCRAFLRLPPEALIEYGRDRVIEAALDYMRERYKAPLSVEELARRAGMGENAFLRRFKSATGGTPYRFLTHLRYAAAARLLEEDRLTIEEIAAEVGIHDRFHFSREFKRFHGESPAAYRQSRKVSAFPGKAFD